MTPVYRGLAYGLLFALPMWALIVYLATEVLS